MKKVALTVFAGIIMAGIITSCSKTTPEEEARELGIDINDVNESAIDNEEVKETDI